MNNNKEYWLRKLTSRKLWIALVGFITPLLLAFGVSESTASEIAGIIMAGASCIAYILGEGLVDAENAKSRTAEKNEGEAE